MSGSPGNNDRDDQRRKNHQYAQRFPDHAPGHIFQQPKHDMQIFHSSKFQGNLVDFFGLHATKVGIWTKKNSVVRTEFL
jgi:hypothetical protein